MDRLTRRDFIEKYATPGEGQRRYAGSGDRTIHAIKAGSGKVTQGFPAQKYPVVALSMSPDGRRIAAVYRDATRAQRQQRDHGLVATLRPLPS